MRRVRILCRKPIDDNAITAKYIQTNIATKSQTALMHSIALNDMYTIYLNVV